MEEQRRDSPSKDELVLVPTVTVDAVSSMIGKYPDFLKIDVEGAELSVLKGSSKTLQERKPKVIVEVHTDALKSDCLEFLGSLGYVGRDIEAGATPPTQILFTPS